MSVMHHYIPSSFATFPCSSSPFILTKLLCVPSFNENLISIHQLCLDNNVYFKFYFDHFVLRIATWGVLFFKAKPVMVYTPSHQPPLKLTQALMISLHFHCGTPDLANPPSKLSNPFFVSMAFHLIHYLYLHFVIQVQWLNTIAYQLLPKSIGL